MAVFEQQLDEHFYCDKKVNYNNIDNTNNRSRASTATTSATTTMTINNKDLLLKYNNNNNSAAETTTTTIKQFLDKNNNNSSSSSNKDKNYDVNHYYLGSSNGVASRHHTHAKAPLRILIFNESFYPYLSGISRRFIEIITRLAKQNFKIHLVTGTNNPDGWINDEKCRENISFSRLWSIAFINKIDCSLPFLFPQPGILTEILKFKPDVIHVVEHTPAAILCAAFAKSLNIPLICSSHTHLDSYIPLFIHKFALPVSFKVYRYVRKEVLSLADCNLTVSSDFVQLLSDTGVDSKIHVWKTGVDSQLFNPIYRSHEMRLRMFNGHYAEDKILLVSVGRISPEKNFEFLLKIIENFPQTFLCIVGDGPKKCREHLENLFPKDRTHFVGFLQGQELASAYASADYFIYASVSETFGQVYLEAMSSGTPVVAAEGKQMKEFFVNGVHGHTWTPDDVDSACVAMRKSIENRDRLARNCRRDALKHSWDSSAEQIITLYSQQASAKNSDDNKRAESGGGVVKTLIRSVYYFLRWLYYMILVLIFMAPFVTKPKNTATSETTTAAPNHNMNTQHNSKQTTTTTTSTDSDSTSSSSSNKFLFLYEYISEKIYDESNRICGAFLATLSALFLSLIVSTIYAMLNGKLNVAYFFTFFY